MYAGAVGIDAPVDVSTKAVLAEHPLERAFGRRALFRGQHQFVLGKQAHGEGVTDLPGRVLASKLGKDPRAVLVA